VLGLEFPDITLIKSDKNLGFAGANNLGFRRSSGKFVLFLNPDTKLVTPAIDLMLARMQALPDAGVVGCQLLNRDLSVQTSSIMRFPTILGRLLEFERFRLRCPRLWGIGPLFSTSAEPVSVQVISGACMLVGREAFEKVGMFSDDFFMYAEDTDLCYKMKRAGFANYYVGGAKIVHYGGQSSNPDWALKMKVKSELLFCSKNRGPLFASAFRVALICNAIGRLGAVACIWPLTGLIGRREELKATSAKWCSILKVLVEHHSV
jgi:GT2 family glycosyltransferase